VLTQQKRTIVSEEHYIYRPTDGEEISFSIFVTDDAHGDWDITRSIICMPDWHGPTDDMKFLAQDIANKTNWRVFMPDIYGKGRCAEDVETARALYEELDYTQTVQDIGWIAKKLRSWQPGSGIGACGFSVGGAMALEACAASEDIFTAVSWYGLPAEESWEDLAWALLQSKKPIQLHHGEKDTLFPHEKAKGFADLLKLNRNDFKFYSYNLQGHAFMSAPEYREQLAQPVTSGAEGAQAQSMVRGASHLLAHTPRFNLDSIHDMEFWMNPYELAPNDPAHTAGWKRY
jgi:dienelactone hydrolase